MPGRRISLSQKKCKKTVHNFGKSANLQEKSIDIGAIKKIFTKKAINKIAKACGFIQRQRKLTPYNFLISLSFGSLKSRLITLASIVECLAVDISRISVHDRFTEAAYDFMANVYSHCFRNINADLQAIDVRLLNKFNRVNIIDSSCWKLTEGLKEIFPGYSGAGCKVQLMIDYKTGSMQPLDITAGNYNDQKYARNIGKHVESNDLLLTDLGYTTPREIKEVDERGAFFISRFNYHAMALHLKKEGSFEVVDVLKTLRKFCNNNNSIVEIECYAGNKKDKVKVRFIGVKVPLAVANQRRRKKRIKARSKGTSPVKTTLELCDWTLFITNIPKEKGITAEEILAFYPIRWSIELFFKQFKSMLNIHKTEVRKNAIRLKCEIMGKCIVAMFISYCYGVARTYTWNKLGIEISFEKTVKLFKRTGSGLVVILLVSSIRKIMEFIRVMIELIVYTCQKYRQKSRTNTLDALIEGLPYYKDFKYVKINQHKLVGLDVLT